MNAAEEVEIKREVNPGEEIDVEVMMITPEAPGLYTSFWRLATNDGKKFGQRVWCKVHVDEKPSVTEHVMMYVDDDNKVKSEESQTGAKSLVDTLVEMGFLDRQRNMQLISEYNGDLNTIVALLSKHV